MLPEPVGESSPLYAVLEQVNESLKQICGYFLGMVHVDLKSGRPRSRNSCRNLLCETVVIEGDVDPAIAECRRDSCRPLLEIAIDGRDYRLRLDFNPF